MQFPYNRNNPFIQDSPGFLQDSLTRLDSSHFSAAFHPPWYFKSHGLQWPKFGDNKKSAFAMLWEFGWLPGSFFSARPKETQKERLFLSSKNYFSVAMLVAGRVIWCHFHCSTTFPHENPLQITRSFRGELLNWTGVYCWKKCTKWPSWYRCCHNHGYRARL